jgi:ferrous iron transport protein A
MSRVAAPRAGHTARQGGKVMTLDMVRRGDHVRILKIDDPQIRSQAIRFGIGEGADVRCSEKVPSGPIVLRRGRQEIAVGRGLARTISVEAL